MKKSFWALLALSVAGNTVFALLALRNPAPSASADTAKSAATSADASGTAASSGLKKTAVVDPKALDWTALRSGNGDLPGLVASLRAAGFPPAVLRAVVSQLLEARYAALNPANKLPFWKHARLDAATLEAQQALNAERVAQFETLLGPDGRPSALISAAVREQRFGPLPDDKVDAISRIEHDYGEMTSKIWAARRGAAPNGSEMMLQQQAMEKEKQADLAAVLSPDELLQYQMRNSQSATFLATGLQKVDVSGEEYAQLFQVQKAFDDANPTVFPGNVTGGMQGYAQRQAAQLAEYEQVRAVLGEDRFYKYLETADFNYTQTRQLLAQYPSVTPAVSYQVYQLQTELQNQMMFQSINATSTPEERQQRMAAIRTLAEANNTKLVALLGADIAAAYRKQGNGQIFNSFRVQLPAGK